MSGRTITKFVLACDGCSTEIEPAQSSTEARGAAYAAGWRFPPRLKGDGSHANDASDVCPKCLPDWTPRPTRVRGGNRPREARP